MLDSPCNGPACSTTAMNRNSVVDVFPENSAVLPESMFSIVTFTSPAEKFVPQDLVVQVREVELTEVAADIMARVRVFDSLKFPVKTQLCLCPVLKPNPRTVSSVPPVAGHSEELNELQSSTKKKVGADLELNTKILSAYSETVTSWLEYIHVDT